MHNIFITDYNRMNEYTEQDKLVRQDRILQMAKGDNASTNLNKNAILYPTSSAWGKGRENVSILFLPVILQWPVP